MSTRANIVITDNSGDKLFFYRHSDGYPNGTLPTLDKFMKMVSSGKIRDNIGQAAGHLIVIGRQEYAKYRRGEYAANHMWQVGAYEPTTGIHGDVDYVYRLNLSTLTIDVFQVASGEQGNKLIKYITITPPKKRKSK